MNIYDIIERTFNDEIIHSFFEHWSEIDWLKSRVPILGESILSFQDGRYYSAISTLLPRIEGLIIERGNAQDILYYSKPVKTFRGGVT